jgi:DamX protein
MADIPPNNPLPGAPTGAEPLKKSTGKVQPKKETVRINLPPKPTAAPTIKLPTLPPGGPTGAPSPAFAPAPTAAAPTKAPAAAAPTKTGAAPVAAQRPAPVQRPVTAAPAVPSIKPLDTILIYAAGVAALIAVGGAVWVFLTLKNVVENFSS